MRLLTDDEVARLRRRRTEPAFAAAWAALEATAGGALAETLEVPAEGAGWYHDYFCLDHATELEYDPATPHAHRCPVDGRIFSGEPYDGAWRTLTNRRLVDGLHAAALTWLVGGEERYAAHAAALLDDYAARYPCYEPHGEHAGQGRCMGQSLDEATWSIPLAWAYDAVRDTLEPARRARIEDQLLRPAAEHLLTQLWRRIHNIECWHLAALATLGVVLDDDRFLELAFDPDYGYVAQLREGVLEDGWWWEGSPTYHFYTLSAVLALVAALRHREPELVAQPRLKAMFDAPLGMARADLSLPATNDGWFDAAEPGFLGRHAASYELACALWQDPAHAALLARVYAGDTPRDTVEALLYGPDALPAPQPPRIGSRLYPAIGYAVLRHAADGANGDSGTGERERWLLLKYGPHGGGHGHPDKLALDLHAFGRRLSPDLGTPGYGIPLNRSWYRQTLSHNTVLIAGEPQPPATGTLVRFATADERGYAVADARVEWPADALQPYAGVAARRCILWRPGEPTYFIDLVQVRCPVPRRIDLAWHHVGTLDLPGLSPTPRAELARPDDQDPYGHLSEPREFAAREWTGTWQLGDAGTRCWALDPPGATVVATRAPYNPAAETMSLLLRRVEATEATYLAVFEPFLGQGAIRAVRWLGRSLADEGRLALVVEGDGWHDAWTIYAPGAPRQGEPDLPAGAVRYEYDLGS